MPVEQTNNRVVLKHPKGPTVELLLYGSHILSWKSGSPTNPEISERLFFSAKAPLDGSAPVRGGIPIAFPAFAAPPHAHPEHSKLGIHGFARSEVWRFDKVLRDDESVVSIRLTLSPTPKIREVYTREFQLAFVITLEEFQLTNDLHVTNPASETLEFHALYHTYIRSPSKDVLITPLKGKKYIDKTDKEFQGIKTEMRTRWMWPGGGVSIKTRNLKDLVVWNPQAEFGPKIVDLEEGGWEKYVCVEPGYVRGYVQLEGGKSWVGTQTLVLH